MEAILLMEQHHHFSAPQALLHGTLAYSLQNGVGRETTDVIITYHFISPPISMDIGFFVDTPFFIDEEIDLMFR